MAVSDPSRIRIQDAAADAGSVLAVDDHGAARDAAEVGVGADGERPARDRRRRRYTARLQARVDVHRRGFALVSADVGGAVLGLPGVRVDGAYARRGRNGGWIALGKNRVCSA